MNLIEIAVGKPSRARALALVGVRAGLRVLSAAAPPLAAAVAERLWFTPPPRRMRPGRAALDSGHRMVRQVNGAPIVYWTWGGGPRVMLMHGWAGDASQLCGFVEPLLAAGFGVVTFDAPGHGESRVGRVWDRRVSFVDFAAAMKHASAAFGPVNCVVAHSSGCGAVGLALRQGWRVERAVFLAPMAKPAAAAERFAQLLGLSARVMSMWQTRAEQRLDFRWDELDLALVPKWANTPSVLVIHDRDDAEVDFSEGEAVAESWPEAELHATQSLGHRRILRDRSVIDRAVVFLKAGLSIPKAQLDPPKNAAVGIDIADP